MIGGGQKCGHRNASRVFVLCWDDIKIRAKQFLHVNVLYKFSTVHLTLTLFMNSDIFNKQQIEYIEEYAKLGFLHDFFILKV